MIPREQVAAARGLVFSVIVIAFFSTFGCGGGSGGSNTTAPPTEPSDSHSLSPAEINLKYNYAPSSRTLRPRSVYKSSATVQNPSDILTGQIVRLSGNGSYVTLDFGKEVSGLVALTFAGSSDNSQKVGLAFSESSLYVGLTSDGKNTEGALYADVVGRGTYIMATEKLRGGFRYLTIFLDSDGWVELSKVSLQFTAAPGMSNPQAYSGYFYSNDDLLNRIWYAGAYTVELNTIDPAQARTWPPPPTGWANDSLIGSGISVLVDGAKRDRNIWAGDVAIAQPAAFVSMGDTESSRNTLNSLYQQQSSVGAFPFAGPPSNTFGSDTYHLWSLIASADYILFSDDKNWLDTHWAQYKAAVQYSLNRLDSDGLLSVTYDQRWDWGRKAQNTGEVLGANVLLYRVLVNGAKLARVESDATAQAGYTGAADKLKQTINATFWDDKVGAYINAPGSSLYPQDGNSLAVWYGVTDSPAKNVRISQVLAKNWNGFGSQSPEKPNAIAPFIGGMEVNAHFLAGEDGRALQLIRLEWGYMLSASIGTGSTFWEGYLSDGMLEPSNPDGIPWYGPGEMGPFMSLAHGWSAGVTSSLTFYVLGIRPASGTEVAFSMIPHPGDLTHAEGRLPMPKGSILVSWSKDTEASTFTEKVTPPAGMLGLVGVPTFGKPIAVYVDNNLVWNGCIASPSIASFGFESATSDSRYVYLHKMVDSHVISSTSKCP